MFILVKLDELREKRDRESSEWNWVRNANQRFMQGACKVLALQRQLDTKDGQ